MKVRLCQPNVMGSFRKERQQIYVKSVTGVHRAKKKENERTYEEDIRRFVAGVN